jgi:alkanesulfonate monooxygenase SsuD/methylene tetrahydromethanopterin reductase-like flavin-dependent oxidoreductase (luciferase family)
MSDIRVGAMFRPSSPPEELRRYAREVEAFGYDELWIVEDCFFNGGVSAAAVALAETDHLTVGLGILPAVLRNPALTAMELATLARLFPGRVHGGIGHGVPDWMRQVGAYPSSPLTALEEVTAAVRALLAGETVTVAGGHVHLDAVRLDHPPAVVPPVSTGVRSVKSLRLSGRVADGTILTELSTTGYLRWAREQIDAGRAEAGRTDPHRLTVYALLSHGDDAARARAAVRPEIARFLRAGGLATQLGAAGLADEVDALVEATADAGELAAALPETWIDQLAVAGDTAQCVRSVELLREAGADAVVLVPSVDPVVALDQLATASRAILPHVH